MRGRTRDNPELRGVRSRGHGAKRGWLQGGYERALRSRSAMPLTTAMRKCAEGVRSAALIDVYRR